eukprot:2343058-Rhodomonas_salina.1
MVELAGRRRAGWRGCGCGSQWAGSRPACQWAGSRPACPDAHPPHAPPESAAAEGAGHGPPER